MVLQLGEPAPYRCAFAPKLLFIGEVGVAWSTNWELTNRESTNRESMNRGTPCVHSAWERTDTRDNRYVMVHAKSPMDSLTDSPTHPLSTLLRSPMASPIYSMWYSAWERIDTRNNRHVMVHTQKSHELSYGQSYPSFVHCP